MAKNRPCRIFSNKFSKSLDKKFAAARKLCKMCPLMIFLRFNLNNYFSNTILLLLVFIRQIHLSLKHFFVDANKLSASIFFSFLCSSFLAISASTDRTFQKKSLELNELSEWVDAANYLMLSLDIFIEVMYDIGLSSSFFLQCHHILQIFKNKIKLLLAVKHTLFTD